MPGPFSSSSQASDVGLVPFPYNYFLLWFSEAGRWDRPLTVPLYSDEALRRHTSSRNRLSTIMVRHIQCCRQWYRGGNDAEPRKGGVGQEGLLTFAMGAKLCSASAGSGAPRNTTRRGTSVSVHGALNGVALEENSLCLRIYL